MITNFGRATIKDRYLLAGETGPRDMFKRVADAYSDNQFHSARLQAYMLDGWFMPSTPILTNGGTDRGLPISCFLNTVDDTLDSIIGTFNENGWLAARGGGIGTHWSSVRSIGEPVSNRGYSSGIIPFLKVMDSQTLAISQGTLRRGSAATYLDVSHPEIEEFIEMRRVTGGDPNRKCLNLHHGVCISDEFMKAVEENKNWHLVSPLDGMIKKTLKARELWSRILLARLETGEPYLFFTDTVQRAQPEHHRKAGLPVTQSNLCTEIMLPTNNVRTAVCCLASVNLEYYDEWVDNKVFIEDIMRMLANVLKDFVEKSEFMRGFDKARYSAINDRSIGLGVMGFHSFLQKKLIPFESVIAKSWNNKMFRHISEEADKANIKMGEELGEAPDRKHYYSRDHIVEPNKYAVAPLKYFSHCIAIAPTASISIICGETSPGIEPISAVTFTQKTLSGTFTVRNKYFNRIMNEYLQSNSNPAIVSDTGKWIEDQWHSIASNGGSVQHLEWLPDDIKEVFKTAFEIDQRYIIQFAADRTQYIDQGQSVNIFLPANIDKRDLHGIHWMAWQSGLKSLYYCRSKSIQRASNNKASAGELPRYEQKTTDYEECLVCQ